MNEIKKAVEHIPLPDHLHDVAYKHLNKSTPKRSKRWILPTVAMIFLSLFATTIVFSNFFSISDFFESKEEKLSVINESKIVVESDMFLITLKEFVDYKENTLLIHELNNLPYTLSDTKLIDLLIENELFLYEAKDHGIVATKQEINEYAQQTKQAVIEGNDPIINQINEALAKNLGVNLEEYFTHPTTLKQYELVIVSEKYFMQLYSDEVLTDQYTLEHYQTDLHEKYKNHIKVNEDILKTIEGQ